MASNYEKLIGAEWLAVMMIETGDALGTSGPSGKFNLPSPSRYFATMIVYLGLAGAAMFGDRIARGAAMFGGVAALAIAMAPNKKGGKPVILSFIDYLTQMINGGSAGTLVPKNQPATTTQGNAKTPLSSPDWSNPLFWGNDIVQEAGKLSGLPLP